MLQEHRHALPATRFQTTLRGPGRPSKAPVHFRFQAGISMSATKFPIPPPLNPRSSVTSLRPRPEESWANGGHSSGRYIGISPTFAIHRDWGEGHLSPVTAPSRQGTRSHGSGSCDGGSFLEPRRITIGISPTFAIHRGWRQGHLAPVPAMRRQGTHPRDSGSCDGGP